MDVPANFKPLERSSPFLDLIAPIYCRQADGGLIFAIRVAHSHCNARGYLHGGVLSTLADIALGYNVAYVSGKPGGMVTANLSIDYIGAVEKGEWLEIDVVVAKIGGTLAFANCHFRVDEKPVARASAVFCRPARESPPQAA